MSSKGFTLIEIFIVILIISILVTLAIPKFEQMQIKAEFAEVLIGTNHLIKEIDIFFMQGCTGFEMASEMHKVETSSPTKHFIYSAHIFGKDQVGISIIVRGFSPTLCSITVYSDGRRVWKFHRANPWSESLKRLIPGAVWY